MPSEIFWDILLGLRRAAQHNFYKDVAPLGLHRVAQYNFYQGSAPLGLVGTERPTDFRPRMESSFRKWGNAQRYKSFP